MIENVVVSPWMYVLFFWVLVWTAIASWKAARRGHISWFVVFFLLNTFGVLPILYIVLVDKVRFFSVDSDLKKLKKAPRKRQVKNKKGVREKRKSGGYSRKGGKLPVLFKE